MKLVNEASNIMLHDLHFQQATHLRPLARPPPLYAHARPILIRYKLDISSKQLTSLIYYMILLDTGEYALKIS